MATKLTIVEDSSERVVVREKPDSSLTLLLAHKETAFDKLLQKAIRDYHFLFWRRRREIPFSEIQSVNALGRSAKGLYTISAQDCEIRLVLTNGKKLEIGRGWLDSQTRRVAERIAEVVRRPLIWLGEEQKKPAESAN